MEQDQDDKEYCSTEIELLEECRKGHLKSAVGILTEESKNEDYDDKKNNEAWRHITEASKQQRFSRQLTKKAEKHRKTQMMTEPEKLTSTVKKKDQKDDKNGKDDQEHDASSSSKNDQERKDHEAASSSSQVDKAPKEPSYPKTTNPCDNCGGTYCDMCNCTKCKDATCKSCLIASKEWTSRRNQTYERGEGPPAWSPQQLIDIAKMKSDNQKSRTESYKQCNIAFTHTTNYIREGRKKKEAEEKGRMDSKKPRCQCPDKCEYGAMTSEKCYEDCKRSRGHEGLCSCLRHPKK